MIALLSKHLCDAPGVFFDHQELKKLMTALSSKPLCDSRDVMSQNCNVPSQSDNVNCHVHRRTLEKDHHKIPHHRNSANMANESNEDFKALVPLR